MLFLVFVGSGTGQGLAFIKLDFSWRVKPHHVEDGPGRNVQKVDPTTLPRFCKSVFGETHGFFTLAETELTFDAAHGSCPCTAWIWGNGRLKGLDLSSS